MLYCRSFAQGVDVLTVEIEHIDASALEEVMQEFGIDVEPTPATLRLIQVRSPSLWTPVVMATPPGRLLQEAAVPGYQKRREQRGARCMRDTWLQMLDAQNLTFLCQRGLSL